MNDKRNSHELNDDFLYAYRQAPPPHAVDALWKRLNQQEEQHMIRKRLYRRFAWSAAAWLVVTLLIMRTPELRTFAQDVFDWVVQAESDELELTSVTNPPPEMFANRTLNGSQATFANAQSYVDFLIPEPIVPAPYALLKFRLFDRTVMMHYHSPNSLKADYPFGILFIGVTDLTGLEPADRARFEKKIGTSAVIVPLDLGHGVQAEYVAGTWVDPVTGEFGSMAAIDSDPDNPYQMVWDNDYPAHFLRWEHDNMLYTLYGYQLELDQADLVGIAISMNEQIAGEIR